MWGLIFIIVIVGIVVWAFNNDDYGDDDNYWGGFGYYPDSLI